MSAQNYIFITSILLSIGIIIVGLVIFIKKPKTIHSDKNNDKNSDKNFGLSAKEIDVILSLHN